MAQFYAEIGLVRSLAAHPARVVDPAAAELFVVPVLPHLSADAGNCNGTRHRARMTAVAAALRMSPHWQRRNGSDHWWACTCVMMKKGAWRIPLLRSFYTYTILGHKNKQSKTKNKIIITNTRNNDPFSCNVFVFWACRGSFAWFWYVFS